MLKNKFQEQDLDQVS